MLALTEILRRIRQEKNLTQENLAIDLNMSLTGYSKIERGETDINFSRLQKIADYYQITIIELLSYGSIINNNNCSCLKEEKQIEYFNKIITLLEK